MTNGPRAAHREGPGKRKGGLTMRDCYRVVKVKICGIRGREEARAAVEAGADALGFILAESRRRVTPGMVREICRGLPPLVARVGVFVNEDPRRVKEIAGECGLDILQFHGQETPSYLEGFTHKKVKAFALKDRDSLKDISSYRGAADAFLLDTYLPGLAGGTGKAFNWDLVKGVPRDRPLVLAGGLGPANILEALERVKPYAVDVSSGVETGGKKDPEKIREFIYKVRSWKNEAR